MARKDRRARKQAAAKEALETPIVVTVPGRIIEESYEKKPCEHIEEMSCYKCLPSPWGKILKKDRK